MMYFFIRVTGHIIRKVDVSRSIHTNESLLLCIAVQYIHTCIQCIPTSLSVCMNACMYVYIQYIQVLSWAVSFKTQNALIFHFDKRHHRNRNKCSVVPTADPLYKTSITVCNKSVRKPHRIWNIDAK